MVTRLERAVCHLIHTGLLVVAVLVSAPVRAATGPTTPSIAMPNLILIVADDLGYGELGCYGQQRIKTPNLDQLAAQGARFTDFYAGSTVCAPSRCSLMTGLHTGHTVIRGNDAVALRDNEVTLPGVLKKAGYSTGLVGKWGLGERGSSGVPQNHGFDQFIGYLNQVHAHDYYTDHLDRYDSITGFNDRNVFHENQGGRQGLYIPDVLTTAALNFVRLQKPSTVNSHPFFLYLAYTIPHANNEAAKVSGHGMQVPDSGPYRDEDWPRPEKNKAAMISRMDADIGKLLQLLKNRNLEQNTVVVFTSDNGPHKEGGVDPAFFQSSGGLRGIKRDLYEGGVRVPLIVRWSGHIKPGQTVSMPVAFWDILPTACELAGLQVPKGIDGISFAPALLGQTQTNRHAYLYWEFHERGFQQALRMDQWKAVRRQTGEPLELYNLETDRKESINVAGKQPQVLARIEEYLKAARTESPFYPARPAVKDNSGRTP